MLAQSDNAPARDAPLAKALIVGRGGVLVE
jgi:hypothetical protein